MVYDWQSGLVYTETVTRSCNCLQESLGCGASITITDNELSRRTRTLWDMARRRLLQKVNDLDSESLKTFPTALVERIWPSHQRDHISIRLWKFLAQSHPALITGRPHRWEYACVTCRGMLPDLVQIANCPVYDWLADLTLDGKYVNQDELFKVSSLRNLRSLVAYGTRSCSVNDRVFRAWADAAAEQGAFGRLVRIAITLPSRCRPIERPVPFLERLRCFPVLNTLCICDESHTFARGMVLGQRCGGTFRCINSTECDCFTAPEAVEVPLLEVSVGSWHKERVPHTICFRRESYALAPARQRSTLQPLSIEVPMKRRKLKEGKIVAWGGLLGTL